LFLAGDLQDSLELYQDTYKELKGRLDNSDTGAIAEERYQALFADLPA